MYMMGLLAINNDTEILTVLDAGAGLGILSCALVEVLQKNTKIKKVNLTCYETDNNIIGANTKPKKYEIVIGNPPYMKIYKDAPEATAMTEVCYGAPNLYFLFASMGLFNLKPNGEMVYIIPRSWTSSAYFKMFREYFLTESKLEHIHLFVSRNKVFDKEDVLQETIIIKVKETHMQPDEVVVTSSQTKNEFENITELRASYNIVVSGEEKYVYLVTDENDIKVLGKLNEWNKF